MATAEAGAGELQVPAAPAAALGRPLSLPGSAWRGRRAEGAEGAAGGAGGRGASCGPRGRQRARRAGQGRGAPGECPRERVGRAGAAMRGAGAGGPQRRARPGATSVPPATAAPRARPPGESRAWGAMGGGRATGGPGAQVPTLQPRGRAQPKLGAVNREVWEGVTPRLGAGALSPERPLPWRRSGSPTPGAQE